MIRVVQLYQPDPKHVFLFFLVVQLIVLVLQTLLAILSPMPCDAATYFVHDPSHREVISCSGRAAEGVTQN